MNAPGAFWLSNLTYSEHCVYVRCVSDTESFVVENINLAEICH